MRTFLAIIFILILSSVGFRAYSDATQEIHVSTVCVADGFCRPEVYIVRSNPAIDGSIQVDYVPAQDPHRWTITVRNIKNATADGQKNYDERGCGRFFQDCPDTRHLRWLSEQRQAVLTVVVDTDVIVERFRLVNVPSPIEVTLDGEGAAWSSDPAGVNVLTPIPSGVHTLVFYMPLPPASATVRAIFTCAYNAFTGLTCHDRSISYTEFPIIAREWHVSSVLRGNTTVLLIPAAELARINEVRFWLFGELRIPISLRVTDGHSVSVCSTDVPAFTGRSCYAVPEMNNTPRLLLAVAVLAFVVAMYPSRRRRKQEAGPSNP